MGSAKRASNWSAGIALISQVACITTFILSATPRLAAPAIHWLDMSAETAHATLPTVSADRRGAARHPAGPNLDQAFEWSFDPGLTRPRRPKKQNRSPRCEAGGSIARRSALSGGEGVPNESSRGQDRRRSGRQSQRRRGPSPATKRPQAAAKKSPASPAKMSGVPSENRTHLPSLKGWCPNR